MATRLTAIEGMEHFHRRKQSSGAATRADANGGEEGIRTLDTVAGKPTFQAGALNHSATSPGKLSAGIHCRERASLDQFTVKRNPVTPRAPNHALTRADSVLPPDARYRRRYGSGPV